MNNDKQKISQKRSQLHMGYLNRIKSHSFVVSLLDSFVLAPHALLFIYEFILLETVI